MSPNIPIGAIVLALGLAFHTSAFAKLSAEAGSEEVAIYIATGLTLVGLYNLAIGIVDSVVSKLKPSQQDTLDATGSSSETH